MSERKSPGFDRMKRRMGPEAFEALRQDTIRLQKLAMAGVDKAIESDEKKERAKLRRSTNPLTGEKK